MRDSYGKEIRAGKIALIEGGIYEKYNTLYVVTNEPNSRFWGYPEAVLNRITPDGRVSEAQDAITFWPLPTYSKEAEEYNKRNATIRILETGVRDWTGVRALFQTEIDTYRNGLELELLANGETDDAENMRAGIAEYEAILATLPADLEKGA